MKVEELMTQPVFTVSHDQSLSDAAQLMWEQDIGWLPVLDKDNRIVATLTDRDIAMSAFLNGTALCDIPVIKAQSQSLITCNETDNVNTIEELMQANQIRRLPVMDDNDELVGIISLNDIAIAYQAGKKGLDAKRLSNTLASICGHHHAEIKAA